MLRQEIPEGIFTIAGFALPAMLLFAWWLVTELELVRPLFLPSPLSVLTEGWRQLTEGILIGDAAVSTYRIMIGWLAATVIAVPIGILMGNYRLIEGLFEPLISTVRYMPVVALIPLSILWAGIGDAQKILILFIGTFFSAGADDHGQRQEHRHQSDPRRADAGLQQQRNSAPDHLASLASGHLGYLPHHDRVDLDVSGRRRTCCRKCRSWPAHHGRAALSFHRYDPVRNSVHRRSRPVDRLSVQALRQILL
jgi:hypothetical protein